MAVGCPSSIMSWRQSRLQRIHCHTYRGNGVIWLEHTSKSVLEHPLLLQQLCGELALQLEHAQGSSDVLSVGRARNGRASALPVLLLLLMAVMVVAMVGVGRPLMGLITSTLLIPEGISRNVITA